MRVGTVLRICGLPFPSHVAFPLVQPDLENPVMLVFDRCGHVHVEYSHDGGEYVVTEPAPVKENFESWD